MDLRIIVLALTLCLGLPAMAQTTTVISAVETTISTVTVPPGPSGRLSFKKCPPPCDDEYVVARLTPSTIYTVDGTAMDFAAFRREFYRLRGSRDAYTLIAYDTETDTVTRVNILNPATD